ncbi:MAG: Stp1/IreP family PP2C-type Ser/Thr phosphatase [Lachnospiraceae bacterium]|nr:Stp1/IreP family PP2C-type Ser/Thr phosphatase [Lachnospiraceae bacterium]MBP5184073.1 Stp1/IreP family PP2C-type Ser/Thr phosphatase [Lachnospiraceae bacterium]
MDSFAITDIGKTREVNQDYIFRSEEPVGPLPNLFIVADGMGGHNAGDFASRFCVEEFVSDITEANGKTLYSTLDMAFQDICEKLIKKSHENSALEGMGTTFVTAFIKDGILHASNIGDSRLYLLHPELEQISMDHSLVAEMVRNGDISEEMARFHPNKNIVTRAISANGIVVPDYFEVPVNKGDCILMCSDGLSNMVENREIQTVVRENRGDARTICETLVEMANANGGKDNISVIVIFV